MQIITITIQETARGILVDRTCPKRADETNDEVEFAMHFMEVTASVPGFMVVRMPPMIKPRGN